MTFEESLRWVRPPLQDRSQKTMERLLASAEECIVEVGFEKATIAQIAKRADSSVGAFYARFSDKDALLRCLIDRFVYEAKATMDAAMKPSLWGEKPVSAVCAELLAFLSAVLTERRLLIVAIAKASMDDPAVAEFRGALSTHAALGLARLLETRTELALGDRLERSMRVVTWVCVSVLEINCVQRPATVGGISHDEFTRELGTMIVSYLGLSESA